jgi:hypothetical protein
MGSKLESNFSLSITSFEEAGISLRSAVIRQACAVVRADAKEIWISVDLLRNNGFEAAYVTETDGSL